MNPNAETLLLLYADQRRLAGRRRLVDLAEAITAVQTAEMLVESEWACGDWRDFTLDLPVLREEKWLARLRSRLHQAWIDGEGRLGWEELRQRRWFRAANRVDRELRRLARRVRHAAAARAKS